MGGQEMVVATSGPAPGAGHGPVLAVPRQADSDETLVALWLHGRSPRTQRAYRSDIAGFLAHVAKPLRAVTRRSAGSTGTRLPASPRPARPAGSRR